MCGCTGNKSGVRAWEENGKWYTGNNSIAKVGPFSTENEALDFWIKRVLEGKKDD